MISTLATVLTSFLLEIALIVLDFGTYSQGGKVRVPLLIGTGLVFMVFVFAALALYQTIRHRHDKEQW